MLKRAAVSAIMVLGFFAGSLTYTYAGAFIIEVPKLVHQRKPVTIKVKADQSTASTVKLSATSRAGTQEYDVNLIDGVGTQECTFDNVGSIILKATDSADPKQFTTKSLHVQFVPGGTR